MARWQGSEVGAKVVLELSCDASAGRGKLCQLPRPTVQIADTVCLITMLGTAACRMVAQVNRGGDGERFTIIADALGLTALHANDSPLVDCTV